jgi:hypothetical protein
MWYSYILFLTISVYFVQNKKENYVQIFYSYSPEQKYVLVKSNNQSRGWEEVSDFQVRS